MNNLDNLSGLADAMKSQTRVIRLMQDQWKNQFRGLSIANDLAKTLSSQALPVIRLNQFEESIQRVLKTNQLWSNELSDRLKTLQLQQFNFQNQIQQAAQQYLKSTQFAQLQGLQSALSNAAAQIVRLGVQHQKFNILRDFESISSNLIRVNEQIISSKNITRDDLQELKELISNVEVRIDVKDNDFLSILIKWITILTFIWGIISTAKEFANEDSQVTKKDLEDFRIQIIEQIKASNDLQFDSTETRLVSRHCNLRVKPNNRCFIIRVLNPEESVEIINTKGKWVQVKVLDMSDSTVNYGWVFKKYLIKTKRQTY